MRSKTLGINVRVTPEEKEKLLKNADYCSLSLSEYLRRLGLGMNVEATVRKRLPTFPAVKATESIHSAD